MLELNGIEAQPLNRMVDETNFLIGAIDVLIQHPVHETNVLLYIVLNYRMFKHLG